LVENASLSPSMEFGARHHPFIVALSSISRGAYIKPRKPREAHHRRPVLRRRSLYAAALLAAVPWKMTHMTTGDLRWNCRRNGAYHNNQPFKLDDIYNEACKTVPSCDYFRPIWMWCTFYCAFRISITESCQQKSGIQKGCNYRGCMNEEYLNNY
jgi:hypothetical protein